MRTTPSPLRLRSMWLLSVVLLVGAAACGGSSGGSPAADATTTTTAAGGAASVEAYQACLTQNGIDIPFGAAGGRGAGGAGGTGAGTQGEGTRLPRTTDAAGNSTPRATIDPALREKAQTPCGNLLPKGAGAGGGAGGFGANVKAYTAYLSCLKDNGVTVPERTTTSAPTGSAPTDSAPTGSSHPAGRLAGGGARGGADANGVPTFLLQGVDQTATTFVTANDKCKVLLPEPTSSTSTPSATIPKS